MILNNRKKGKSGENISPKTYLSWLVKIIKQQALVPMITTLLYLLAFIGMTDLWIRVMGVVNLSKIPPLLFPQLWYPGLAIGLVLSFSLLYLLRTHLNSEMIQFLEMANKTLKIDLPAAQAELERLRHDLLTAWTTLTNIQEKINFAAASGGVFRRGATGDLHVTSHIRCLDSSHTCL